MILVDVYFPSIDKTRDFLLDETADIKRIVAELIEIMAAETEGETVSRPDDFGLYSVDDKQLLPREGSLSAYGVTDGSRLLLV